MIGPIGAQAKANVLTSRLMSILSIGPIMASQLTADAGKVQSYGSARHFTVAPCQYSTRQEHTAWETNCCSVCYVMCASGDAERAEMAKRDGAVGVSVVAADDMALLECGGLCAGEQVGVGSTGEGRSVLILRQPECKVKKCQVSSTKK